jgi:AcrR family transcriptional regulator
MAQQEINKKRQSNKLRNRADILDAARIVFAQIGYDAANIRDIIRGTNLASGTFYNYFKTKDEVFVALHDEALAKFRPHLEEAYQKANGDMGSFIFLAFKNYFEFKAQVPRISLNNENVLGVGTRHNSPESMAIFNQISQYLREFCIKEQYCNINEELLVASCIGIAQELGLRLAKDSNLNIEETAKFVTRFVMGGINSQK